MKLSKVENNSLKASERSNRGGKGKSFFLFDHIPKIPIKIKIECVIYIYTNRFIYNVHL